MYTVLNSYGISKESNSRWQELNLSALPVNEIFNLYRKVYLKLTAGFLPQPIFVDMDVFRIVYLNFEGTLTDLFTANGNETIQTIDNIPNLDVKRAFFADAFYSGYKVELVEQNDTELSKQIDLKVTRPKTDMEDVYNHCIFSVNGFFHMSDKDADSVYVVNGGNTMLKSRDNHLGIWSWANVGNLQHIKITDEMLFKQNDTSTFSDRVYIAVPDDLENKTVMLFAGGYLVKPEPEIFFPVGNNTYCFNIGRIPMLRRYFESRNHIDYSSLGLDPSTVNDSLISLEQFYSDENIRKYLTLSQSFLVVVDKEDVYFETHPVKTAPMAGMLISYYEPTYPLFMGAGRSPSYWKRYENTQWSITVADNYRQNKAFESMTKDHFTHVADHNQTIKPAYFSQAYLLEAGTDIALD